jgi:hypothetical protein
MKTGFASGVFLIATTMLGVLAAQKNDPPGGTPGVESRLEVAAAPTNDVASIAISPDGRKLAYVGLSEGRSRLWIHTLDSGHARPFPGTEDAVFPFWAPDSRSIAFFGDSKLQRMDAETGKIATLTAVNWPAGGTWGSDGTILFAYHGGQFIRRIDAAARSARRPS